jgi:hypothetical protein
LDLDGHLTMNAQEELFISTINSWSQTPNHPHIHFGFEPVIFAGSIKVRKGKVVYLDNFSGHYQPGPSYFKQFIDVMQSKNCIDPLCTVNVFYTAKDGCFGQVKELLKKINFNEIIRVHHHSIKTGLVGNKGTYWSVSEIIENLRKTEASKNKMGDNPDFKITVETNLSKVVKNKLLLNLKKVRTRLETAAEAQKKINEASKQILIAPELGENKASPTNRSANK